LAAFGFMRLKGRNAKRLRDDRKIITAGVMLGPCFIFWFLGAPDPRLSGPLFWLAGVTLNVLAWELLLFSFGKKATAVLVSLNLLFGLALVNRWGIVKFSPTGDLPKPAIRVEETRHNLKVNYPYETGMCHGTDLPCTPTYDPNLALRVPNSLRHGFMKKGRR
jgi:hypothetical protein